MNTTIRHRHLLAGISLTLIITLLLAAVVAAAQNGGKRAGSELPLGSQDLIQPEDLVKTLRSDAAKPAVLYVGPRFLYAQAHIPGAEFIGSAADSESLNRLRKRVASLPKNSHLVLYCGCCPWEHCPNIRPAYQELQKLGFTQAKALYLSTSFGSDWVEKGYPVEKGEPR